MSWMSSRLHSTETKATTDRKLYICKLFVCKTDWKPVCLPHEKMIDEKMTTTTTSVSLFMVYAGLLLSIFLYIYD